MTGGAVPPIDLPQHVASGDEWREWPRKLEAHLIWGVRQRQIEAYTRNGRLRVYACPDDTKRLDPDALRELFGEPGVIGGRDRDVSAAERTRRQAEAAAVATGDPTVIMFGRAVAMLEATHAQLIGQLKLIADPIKVVLDANRETIAAQAKRIVELEARQDAERAARAELEDARQERDLQLRKHQASERRRDETLALLKEQVPELIGKFLSGDSLSGFAKRSPRDVVQAMIDSGAISEADAVILRKAAGIPPAAEQTTQNGVSSHGHS